MIAPELAAGFPSEIKVGRTGIPFLDLTGEIQFSGRCVEIEVLLVECDQFADAKAGIHEEDDNGFVAVLEIRRKRFRKTCVANCFDLFGIKPRF